MVTQARDLHLDRRVALKLVPVPGLPGVLEQATREGRVLARVAHPCVVGVYDTGGTEVSIATGPCACLFIALELIDGVTLDRWMASDRRDRGELLALLARVGEGLAAVHAAGLVHRDVKPANVVVERSGRVVLVDFGLARPAPGHAGASRSWRWFGRRTTVVVGTPGYMAPEVVAGETPTQAADVWAFAAMAWEAIAGVQPAPDWTRTWRRRWWRVPRELREPLTRALTPNPVGRTTTITELVDALGGWSAARAKASKRRRAIATRAAVVTGLALTLPIWAPGAAVVLETASDAMSAFWSNIFASFF